MKHYIGFDTSSFAIHAAIIDEEEKLVKLLKWNCNKKAKFEERFPELITNFNNDVQSLKGYKASLENAIPVRNSRAYTITARVVGAVWALLATADIRTEFVHQATWKKVCLGNGQAKKDDIMKYAIEKWGDEFPEQDYADAVCIALWNKRRLVEC
jgi:Holliday junction resolvasome RuvABC endonuclease subunit